MSYKGAHSHNRCTASRFPLSEPSMLDLAVIKSRWYQIGYTPIGLQSAVVAQLPDFSMLGIFQQFQGRKQRRRSTGPSLLPRNPRLAGPRATDRGSGWPVPLRPLQVTARVVARASAVPIF